MLNDTGPTTHHRAVRRKVLGALAFGVAVLAGGSVATAAKPEIDPSYAAGQIYYMIGPHIISNAKATNPNLYAKSEELYLLVYPINGPIVPPFTGDGHTEPMTVGNNYQPLCNPCYHPGLPGAFAYHDHVLTGAPGLGKNGTAGEMKAPWKIIVLVYDATIIHSPTFVPIKDAADIDRAEQQGMFQMINPTGSNPFEIETGNVLICPLVAPEA